MTYFSKEQLENEKLDYSNLRFDLIINSVKYKGKKYIIDVRKNYRECLIKHWFVYTDNKDHLIIRFFINTMSISNLRLFLNCRCGIDNSARHVVNQCAER